MATEKYVYVSGPTDTIGPGDGSKVSKGGEIELTKDQVVALSHQGVVLKPVGGQLRDVPVADLRSMADGMGIDTAGMNKTQIIDAIDAATTPAPASEGDAQD